MQKPFLKSRKRYEFAALVFGMCSILYACTTPVVSVPERCMASDWFEVGFRDGQLGRPASESEVYRSKCKFATPAFNAELYEAGRSRGLVSYCSFKNGFEVGKMHALYQKVCPENLESSFLEGMRAGEISQPGSQSRF